MTASAKTAPLAELRSVSKGFPGVQALDDVSLEVRAGEILAVAGENGSGKSTLVKILSGAYSLDAGEIFIGGEPVELAAPVDAVRRGIALVAQEVQVQQHLTVAENLMFGSMPKRRLGLIDWAAAAAQSREVLAPLGLEIDPRALVGSLPLHLQHMISIAAALHRRPKVLVLDEPTASLPEEHVEALFTALRRLSDDGGAVLYITHRLREYFELCHRVLVLRDGELVAERDIAATDEDELIALMVGRRLASIFVRPEQRRPVDERPPVLEVRGLSTPHKLADVDLRVGKGEIVGVAGQAGAGRSTLARALFGAEPHAGTVLLDGRETTLRSPAHAIRAGMAYVPDDRKGAGLVLTSSVHDNLTLPSWSRVSRGGVAGRAAERSLVDEAITQLRIRTPSPRTPALSLSGGNQQKIVIAKWLARNPALLILDEPTRGVDVGAKAEIYRLIESLAEAGLGVLVLSSELLELIRLSDRIVVMRSGRVVGEQDGDAATEESITAMAFTHDHDLRKAA